jgi:hypothetical protein
MAGPSYRSLLKRFEQCPDGLKNWFSSLPSLLESFPYDISIAYLFLRVEQVQNLALYCGLVKLHQADTGLARKAVETQHLTRDGFLALYASVFGKPFSNETRGKIVAAEKVRDRVVHGKTVEDSELRKAIADVLDYAEALNTDVKEIAGFGPFEELRGFKGRAESLGPQTTRWLVKGLGFSFA